MNAQNRENLKSIYKEILDRHEKGVDALIAVRRNNIVTFEKNRVFYPKRLVRKLTGHNVQDLRKWLSWEPKDRILKPKPIR